MVVKLNILMANDIICDNIECFASTAEILCPKKSIKVKDLSTVTIGYTKKGTQTNSMKTRSLEFYLTLDVVLL
jgi:hypothetical protein